MLFSMTSAAKRQQIIQSVVSGFSGACHAVSVYMMNLKVILCAATLAGVIVSLQGGLTISTEVIIVSSFVGVSLQSIFVGCKPLVNFTNFFFALAVWAKSLWASFVLEVLSALWTIQCRTNRNYALFQSHLSQCIRVLLFAVGWFTGNTNLLARACWDILRRTRNTFSGAVGHSHLHSRIIQIIA